VGATEVTPTAMETGLADVAPQRRGESRKHKDDRVPEQD
jgi:hypothetical protein